MSTPRCPLCGIQDDPTRERVAAFRCGTRFDGMGHNQSPQCKARVAAQDAYADEYIERRRMARYFEPDHFGI